MDFLLPDKNKYTIYTKSGCPNCLKIKQLFKDNFISITTINCDEYLIENRTEFLAFMKNISNKEIKTFPIVFYNNEYIGGYIETLHHFS
jgi:glutaredoxin